MNRPPLAPDLVGAIDQAEEELAETLRKLRDGEAANGTSGIMRAKHILADARARETAKAGGGPRRLMTVAAPPRLDLVSVIDSPCLRYLYEHEGRYLVVVWSMARDGYVAFRSTKTGEDVGVPIVDGWGRQRAEVLERIEDLLERGEL